MDETSKTLWLVHLCLYCPTKFLILGYVIADDDMSYEESDSEDDVETPFISEVKEKPGNF